MSTITTHVLDTSSGRPAAGVAVSLDRIEEFGAVRVGSGATDADGRLRDLVADDAAIAAGAYRLTFETGAWYDAAGVRAFHPRVAIDFVVADPAQHYHVPLLLSPFGYTTYRGS